MHFPSILISISFVFLQIISKGSCGKCFVQFAFGSRMFNTFAIDTHEPSIVRFALRLCSLFDWLCLKFWFNSDVYLSSWEWELLFERLRQIGKCGWLDFALCLVLTYVVYRSVFILGYKTLMKLINEPRSSEVDLQTDFECIFLFSNSTLIECEIINETKVVRVCIIWAKGLVSKETAGLCRQARSGETFSLLSTFITVNFKQP